MTEEEIDKICAALDESVKPAGFAHFEDAMAASADWMTQIAQDMQTMSDRAATRRWLRETFPEPSPSDVRLLLQLLPNLEYVLRRFAPKMAKQILPHAPGGRPSAVTPALRGQVCREIGDLLVKGLRLIPAYKRLAQRHHVSVRTIQRIWNERERKAG